MTLLWIVLLDSLRCCTFRHQRKGQGTLLAQSMEGSPICRLFSFWISEHRLQNKIDGNACYQNSNVVLIRQLNRYLAKLGANSTMHGSAHSIYLQYNMMEAACPIFSSRKIKGGMRHKVQYRVCFCYANTQCSHSTQCSLICD